MHRIEKKLQQKERMDKSYQEAEQVLKKITLLRVKIHIEIYHSGISEE